MVIVGFNEGNIGNVEIVQTLFTVKSPTKGAIIMEWNVEAAIYGLAGMWDSYFRIGVVLDIAD